MKLQINNKIQPNVIKKFSENSLKKVKLEKENS